MHQTIVCVAKCVTFTLASSLDFFLFTFFQAYSH